MFEFVRELVVYHLEEIVVLGAIGIVFMAAVAIGCRDMDQSNSPR